MAQLIFFTASTFDMLVRHADQFNENQKIISRKISLRLGQHDANLTALGSVVEELNDHTDLTFRHLAQTIMKSYPRIVRIQHYTIAGEVSSPKFELRNSVALRGAALNEAFDYTPILGQVKHHSAGMLQVFSDNMLPMQYVLAAKTERSPQTSIVVMTIDARSLVSDMCMSYNVQIELKIDTNTILRFNAHPYPHDFVSHRFPWFESTLHFEHGNRPFTARIDKSITFAELVEWKQIIRFAVFSTWAIGGGYFLWQKSVMARELRQSIQTTNRKIELIAHENRLIHASRVNSMGELASGIAHELTQPLTALITQSQAGLKLLEREDCSHNCLKMAMSANVREAKRAGHILKRMRDFVAGREPVLELCQINSLVQNILALLAPELNKHGITVETNLKNPSPVSLVGSIELEQVLHNLIRNSIDALLPLDQPEKSVYAETSSDGDTCMIIISDNGTGMPPDVLDNMFIPFFTTKQSGMGLGLPLSLRLLERFGGKMMAENDHGAKFTITLPSAELNR